MTKQASIIPIRETGGGYAIRSSTMRRMGQRGMISYMNYEDVWLNK
jgi:hypothetical protein